MARQFYDRYNRHSDGIHQTAISSDSGQLEGVTDFDFDEIDRNLGHDPKTETPVEMADVSAALAIILQWICGTPDLRNAGARAASLLAYLDPSNAPFDRVNLAIIAEEAGCTRASLSKELLDLRDQVGVTLIMGKLGSSREAYAKAQEAAFKSGRHTAFVRKDSKRRKAKSDAERTTDAKIGK